jgi:cytochrome P450
MWAAYWVIALSLQHTDGLAPLLVEVDACWEAWLAIRPEFIGRRDAQVFQAWLDETPASDTPLLVSVINETLRFVSYTASVRLVAEPTHLAGYALRVGERVMCVARCVHMDPEVHADPSVFEPARYLHKDRKVHEKDGRRVANHTLVFGSGVSICPGRCAMRSALVV